jgi:uncharacterized protein (DUF433 family)
MKDFPDLTPDDIRACLAYAADRERKLQHSNTYSLDAEKPY